MKEKFIKALISFITGAVLAAVILALAGIYPGSEKTLLIFDMREQFTSFYSSLKALFNGDASFIYTFQGSLGTPYIGMFAYYLASPFSFITLLFDTTHLPDGIWLMDLVKCGSMCAAFSVFMDYRGVKDRFINLSLSICYALSSAAITFFILPMYSDTMIWLPLICIFLEKLLKDTKVKNGILYSVFLSGCMYTHYYSAYMVCIFLVFYSVFILTCEDTKQKSLKPYVRKYLYFVLFSLLGATLALPLLKTVIKGLLAGKAYDTGVYSDGGFIVTSPFELMQQFICGHYGSLYSEGAPAIYFTAIAAVLAVYGIYLSSKNRAKTIVSSSIVLIFILSFIFRPFYKVWHMFRDPVGYPHRFAFLFVFFMLVLAGEGISILDDKKNLRYAFLALSAVAIVINGLYVTRMELITLPGTLRSEYEVFIDTTSDLVDYAKEDYRQTEDERVSFCRINKDFEFTSNDPMLLGYNGIDYFSSIYDPQMLSFYKSLGYLQYHYKSCDAGDTVVTGMLLGTDYMIHKYNSDSGLEMITSNGFSTLSRNPYSLGAGYLACDDTCSFGKNPYENQNSLIDSILGEKTELLKPVEYDNYESYYRLLSDGTAVPAEKSTDAYVDEYITFTAPAGEDIYLNFDLLKESELTYLEKSRSRVITVSCDGIIIGSFTGYQLAYNIYVGKYSDESEHNIIVEGADSVRKAFIYSLDTERLEDVYNRINGGFEPESISPGCIEGKVCITNEKRNDLVLTVSYSDSFEAYIDDNPAETYPYAGALLTIRDIPAGEHEIKVIYR